LDMKSFPWYPSLPLLSDHERRSSGLEALRVLLNR
jgi:hypothetical protein